MNMTARHPRQPHLEGVAIENIANRYVRRFPSKSIGIRAEGQPYTGWPSDRLS